MRKILIPFSKKTGNFLNFPMYDEDTEWRENTVFNDIFQIDSFSRGRSAANFNVKSKGTDKTYTMFMKDLFDIMQNASIVQGEFSGIFTFCKRGRNYGVKMVSLI